MQRSKALILFWLICAFAIMQLYEQSINADIVSLDYSSVVESIADLDRHKSYKPSFIQGEYIRENFKRSLDPVKKRIWNRNNRKILKLNAEGAVTDPKDDHVLVGASVALDNIKYYICGISKNNLDKKRPKFLIGTKGFASANVAFHYRGNLSDKLKRLIWHRSIRIGEAGYTQYLAQKCTKPPTGMSPALTSACVCNTKEELYDNVDTLGPIKSRHFASLIVAFCVLLILSSIFLILDRTIHVSLEVLKRIRREEVPSITE